MIRVLNWEKFQHYHKARPPWIKFYRALLDDRAYNDLMDFAARLLTNIWLVAAEGASDSGVIPFDTEGLMWRLRLSDVSKVETALQTLVVAGFIEVSRDSLEEVYTTSRDSLVSDREETETEKSISDGFSLFWETYPKRRGGNPKSAACTVYRRRVLDRDATVDELYAGVMRYEKFCDATGKTGTEYVKQAVSWLGPRCEGWKETWDITPQGSGGMRIL